MHSLMLPTKVKYTSLSVGTFDHTRLNRTHLQQAEFTLEAKNVGVIFIQISFDNSQQTEFILEHT